jgi:ATP-dependent protease ClpP protease subunit
LGWPRVQSILLGAGTKGKRFSYHQVGNVINRVPTVLLVSHKTFVYQSEGEKYNTNYSKCLVKLKIDKDLSVVLSYTTETLSSNSEALEYGMIDGI